MLTMGTGPAAGEPAVWSATGDLWVRVLQPALAVLVADHYVHFSDNDARKVPAGTRFAAPTHWTGPLPSAYADEAGVSEFLRFALLEPAGGMAEGASVWVDAADADLAGHIRPVDGRPASG
jgi:hypothetical protein